MSNASVAGADGRSRRKSLADQLDRLDGVIDDLSEGLNQAVTHVVGQAVTTAVRQAIEGLMQTVLANPELLRNLAAQLGPPAAAEPAAPAEAPLPDAAAGPTRGVPSGPPRRAGGALAAVRRQAGALLDGVRSRLRLVRLPLAVLALAGAAVTAAFLAGPWLAAAAGCLAGLVRHAV